MRDSYKDLAKYPPLSKGEIAFLIKKAQEGNLAARNKIVKHNMRFSFKLATMYARNGIPAGDLRGEASRGLLRAIESFDPSVGIGFLSYAVWWMRAYVTRYIRNNSTNGFKIPSVNTVIPAFWKTKKALLKQVIGGEYIPDIDDYPEEYYMLACKPVCLNPQSSIDVDVPLSKLAIQQEPMSEDYISVLCYIKSVLSEREYEILTMRYGLDGGSPMTTSVIGSMLNISHTRVCQILANVSHKLLRKPNLRRLLRDAKDNVPST